MSAERPAPTERRIDPFTGRGVVLAPSRRNIGGARRGGLPKPDVRCPFCPEHEADTEVTVARWPEAGPWQVRVVKNKYPIVTADGGAHDVGVDARAHDVDLADFDARHASAWLRLYASRVAALERAGAGGAVLFFRNRGRRAGSSQPHPHSQIVRTPWVPHDVAERHTRALHYFEREGRSIHDAELERERRGPRVLEAGARCLVFCPYAPSRPFAMRVAPLDTSARFGQSPPALLDATAMHIVRCARRLRALDIHDFNLVLRQPPVGAGGPAWGWHLDVLPRLGGDAGFELSGGEMIVVVTPEDAAARLREVGGERA